MVARGVDDLLLPGVGEGCGIFGAAADAVVRVLACACTDRARTRQLLARRGSITDAARRFACDAAVDEAHQQLLPEREPRLGRLGARGDRQVRQHLHRLFVASGGEKTRGRSLTPEPTLTATTAGAPRRWR